MPEKQALRPLSLLRKAGPDLHASTVLISVPDCTLAINGGRAKPGCVIPRLRRLRAAKGFHGRSCGLTPELGLARHDTISDERCTHLLHRGLRNHAFFSNDGIDQRCRRDVEHRIPRMDALGHDADAANAQHFTGIAFLDLD